MQSVPGLFWFLTSSCNGSILPEHLTAYKLHPEYQGAKLSAAQTEVVNEFLVSKNPTFIAKLITFQAKSSPYPKAFFTEAALSIDTAMKPSGVNCLRLASEFIHAEMLCLVTCANIDMDGSIVHTILESPALFLPPAGYRGHRTPELAVPQLCTDRPAAVTFGVHMVTYKIVEDTSICGKDKLFDYVCAFQTIKDHHDLDNLVKWSHMWQLGCNEAKCKSLHLGNSNQRLKYQMEAEILEDTKIEKDMGVFIDEELNFHAHVSEVVEKALRLLGLI
ncbi:hypothetical protein LSH36_60g06036 [Paralvinella palmiformis]|uniref:Uncharacterized protein n=1 Tax=Paralvinella palmiformis TaxID=53620 RepID=A0AAD9K4E4_9ANNE|nr:hypothetical protein LSH36_60g06036 [Paralvinella palmiformis]